MSPAKLSTDRLELVAATLEHASAELESPELLGSMLVAQVGSGWPPGEYDRQAQEYFRDKLREGGPAVVGWYAWYVVLRNDCLPESVLVGAAGFCGPPNDGGEVEIGFSILSAWEGRGYATEAVKALVPHAFTESRVRRVIAHTTLQNLASQRVLEKSGFKRASQGVEPGSLRFEASRVTLPFPAPEPPRSAADESASSRMCD